MADGGTDGAASAAGHPASATISSNFPRLKGSGSRRFVWGVLASLIRGSAFMFGSFLIFVLTYLYAHSMLEGVLGGADTTWALALVHWYDRWFPSLPVWYPLQGGGTPLLFFYPPLTSFSAVLIHRLVGFTEAQSLAIIGFASVPITGIGIYLLVWARLRRQTLALIAGLFYPLSGASWYWLTIMGMYAQAVSMMFVPFAFLLFDAYISAAAQAETRKASLGRRLVLPCAAITFALTFLTHPATAFVLSMALLLHSIVLPIFAPSPSGRLPSHLASVRAALIGIASGLGIAAFWVIPFVRNLTLANREGLTEFAAHQVPYTLPMGLLGVGEPNPSVFSAGLTFALPVVVLAGLGLVRAVLRRGQALSWAILAVSFATYTSMPGLWLGLVRVFEKLWAFTQARALVPSIILLPAVAAYGAEGIAEAVLWLPLNARRVLGRAFSKPTLKPSTIPRMLTGGLVALTALGVAVGSVVALEDRLPDRNQFGGYGPPGASGKLPFYLEDSRLALRSPPTYSITATTDPGGRDAVAALETVLRLDEPVRIDNTPNFGSLTQALALYSEASTLNAYNYQSSLIHAMWGYQQGLFYGETHATPRQINELAMWFGIQNVILNREQDNLDKYDPDSWPVIYPVNSTDPDPMEIRHFTGAPPLGSLLRTPVVLVVGGSQNAVYEQVFRMFVDAGISYDEALIVEGGHNIDEYTADELQPFDVVLLHGYGYKNKDRAWGLLEEYVRDGGSLYVDTGWQYWVPDWQMEEIPMVLPVEKLVWSDFGMTTDFTISRAAVADGVQAADFSPLVWEGRPWGVSSAEGGLRGWASPILSVRGTPLIAAGTYGNGRVVWSGMNLIAHAMINDNSAERDLFDRLVLWLSSSPGSELTAPQVQRADPDHIRISLDEPTARGTTILWREAYSPDWRATSIVNGRRTDIPIYRAGPGMMLLMLPRIQEANTIVEMEYTLGWSGRVGVGLTLVTAVGLLLNVVFPGFLGRGSGGPVRRRRDLPQGSVAWAPNLGDPSSKQDGPVAETDPRMEQMSDIGFGGKPRTGQNGIDLGVREDARASLRNERGSSSAANPAADRLLYQWESTRVSPGNPDQGEEVRP